MATTQTTLEAQIDFLGRALDQLNDALDHAVQLTR